MFAWRVAPIFIPGDLRLPGSSSYNLPSAQLHDTGTPDCFSLSLRSISMPARVSIISLVAGSELI